ncbi:MAG: hypothetical protein CVV41_21120 [Candidatus Riflebacteria bacterium HGW-Riflebacteria-1]|jgi:hypothetical protein|nr:MAG: hypothetical protein CVV41_21120 [Candidatus Riflebacteria bacterium HGW-Riflebacteria-1]
MQYKNTVLSTASEKIEQKHESISITAKKRTVHLFIDNSIAEVVENKNRKCQSKLVLKKCAGIN